MLEDSLHRIALEMAVRQLSSQKEDLRNVRNQASIVSAMAGLIATLFSTLLLTVVSASEVFSPENLSLPVIIAFFAFLGAITQSIRVLSGWEEYEFDQSPKWVFEHLDNNKDKELIVRSLALEAEEFFERNEGKVQKAMSELWWASILAWAQMPFWILALFTVDGG